MASVVRQPFAPLDGARLQTLTSAKNRQNSILPTSAKRKALDSIDVDNSENVDPFFSKRAKGVDNCFKAKPKQPSYKLIKPDGDLALLGGSLGSVVKTAVSVSRPRAIASPKAPSSKLASSVTRHHATPAPVHQSPLRVSKRNGLLSSRRRTPPKVTRQEPLASKLAPIAPFSLDAALKGTLSAYASSTTILSSMPPSASSIDISLGDSDLESSWFFDIHEDTPEQEMTNLLQHGTCVLDISSDEESEQKARREKAEGRDKENIPPANDISQVRRLRSDAADDMIVEKARNPLSQLNAADYYAAGCDEASVVLIASDEVEEEVGPASHDTTNNVQAELPTETSTQTDSVHDGPYDLVREDREALTAEELMTRRDEAGVEAALLEPIEGTGESFDVWESGSSKGDTPVMDQIVTSDEDVSLKIVAAAV